jgi:alpha-beta hydrolase superfamily lysophospholipase
MNRTPDTPGLSLTLQDSIYYRNFLCREQQRIRTIMSKYGSVSAKGPTAVLAKQFRLADGRLLGYAEYGDPSGKPIFHFHGWLSSRLEFGPIHDVAQSLGTRVISIDRPGCGLSDLKPGRKIVDWPDDVAALADSLVLQRRITKKGP